MAKTVMIVDDSASIRLAVSLALRSAGYAVLEAQNGKDALGQLALQRVSLVISDVNMPDMDGLGLLDAMMSDPAHQFTPVIMLTTASQGPLSPEMRAAGVRMWMTKPFQRNRLLEAVTRLVPP
jgi:two-component system chemotaxis response regulator CheY